MARGEPSRAETGVARRIAIVASVIVALFALLAICVFPRFTERRLLAPDLSLRRVDNAFGWHCELVRREERVSTPWPCGANARWPDYAAARDVVHVLDSHRECAVEISTLRTLGCVGSSVDWMGVTGDTVAIITSEVHGVTGQWRHWLTRIDRVTGARGSVELPDYATPMIAGSELILVTHESDARAVYAPTPTGLDRLAPDEAEARYALAVTTMGW